MKLYLAVFFSTLFLNQIIAQELTKVAVIEENSYKLIDADNRSGIIFISLKDLAANLKISLSEDAPKGKLILNFNNYTLNFTTNVPFVKLITKSGDKEKTETLQLINSPYTKQSKLFVSLNETTDLFNSFWNKKLIQLGTNRIKVIDPALITENESTQKKEIVFLKSISFTESDDNIIAKIQTSGKVNNFYNYYRKNNLHLILWDVDVAKDSLILPQRKDIVNKINIVKGNESSELQFELNKQETITEILNGENDSELIIRISERDFGDWYTKESEHFKIIYRDAHSHLVNYLLSSAENSLKSLVKLFNYQPAEKIIINTYDVSDYGFAATTTVPENYIRIEIEPLEPGYEMVPYNERLQWLLSHELVHIVVNDMATDFEASLRTVFGKVTPDKSQPLTIGFSLLTNNSRYTPRWYQEAMAVFIETWFSGGYGRILGNFDEMYFRTLVYEGREFPNDAELEQILTHKSIFLETLFYTYGARFIAHLSNDYGVDKLLKWYSTEPTEFYPGFKRKFEKIFGIDFDLAWDNFIKDETTFQKQNIELLNKYPLTKTKRLSDKSFGWVTQSFFDKRSNSVLFGYHRAGELAELQSFNLSNYKSLIFTSLPSPSMIQVASNAYDDVYRYLFFTTNNNQLYRDVWLYDLKNDKARCLFPDSRVGQLTVSPETHELWGIQHISGKSVLVRSKYPYSEMLSLSVFDFGDEFQQLSINRKGGLLAASLHKSNGQQSIIISDVRDIDKGKPFTYKTITSSGSPENPSWSDDGKFIYWNAYTNGVSNIFKYNLSTDEITPLTHSITGLFKPIELPNDSLLAMEFTLDGFFPVVFANHKTEKLPAINYFGQNILQKSPEVISWNLKPAGKEIDKKLFTSEEPYNGLKNVRVQTFIPVITGFQSRKVLGFFAQLNDPIFKNDLIIETGVSPFKETTNDVKYHLRLKYSLNQKLILAYDYNAPDFFDLFNKRKRGMLGSKFTIGYTNYWTYDNPLRMRQSTELVIYNGIKFINDNLTEVRQPDFAVLKTEFDYRYLRKTIGSIDWEHGDQFKFTLLGYGSNPDEPEYSGQIFAEWDHYSLYLLDHNVFHFKLTSGYHFENEKLPETMFFFGGFGNRAIENEPVKQFAKMFRFPGVPIYSITADRFVKVIVGNSFPPIRIPNIAIGSLELKNINFSIFSQGLLVNNQIADKFIDAGAQINIMFEHWFNLESTVSAGFAKAWWKNGNDTEWFISWKLLKD